MTMIKYSVNPEERPKVSFKLILKPLINVPFLAHRSWWTQTYNFINTCWGEKKKVSETNVSAVQSWKSQKGVFFLSDHERNFANGL